MAKFRLSAHNFTVENGFVSTELFMTKARTEVEAASLDELTTKIREFGALHTPCNVWVGPGSKPTLRGFEKWNRANGAAKWLFEAPAPEATHAGA